MDHDPNADLFRVNLLARVDFELTGSDPASGKNFLFSVRHGNIDLAAFSRVDPNTFQKNSSDCLAFCIAETQYRIEPSFVSAFLQAVQDSACTNAVSVTVQTSFGQIDTFYGRDSALLADFVAKHLPVSMRWAPKPLTKESRDWGRKIGHAAKDLNGIRETAFGVEDLKILERTSEADAYEAVHKEAVWQAPNLDMLHCQGVSPEVAFGIVSCWRMLKHRPARKTASRLSFVRELPLFRTALERCRTVDDLKVAVWDFVTALRPDATAVIGPRLPRFAQRLVFPKPEWFANSDSTLAALLRIEKADEAAKWAIARAALAQEPVVRKPAGLPMPTRQPKLLDQLQRSGPDLPAVPAFDRDWGDLGLTGVEFGNYVTQREGQVLERLLTESLTDLRYLLGDWVVRFCRRGNLSVALGSRGKGKACAHYDPGRRVISLTKTHGDGSLAHEFAHFFDQMLAIYAPGGEARFLSARVTRGQTDAKPVSTAMASVMHVASASIRRYRVVGEVNPKEWYKKQWIAAQGYAPERTAQESFDIVADRNPDKFRRGRKCEPNSVLLVHSLAKHCGSQVDVEVAFEEPSRFRAEAVRLGVYWKRPEELFARAFESFLEDELADRGQCSQYLVFGTQRDYADCRGIPYPVGDERKRIAEKMRNLFAACEDAE